MPNAATFRHALDQIGDGIVLLDSDYRAVFINRAFRNMWRLPDAVADASPAFADIVRHARDLGAYQVAPADLDAYVAERIAQVQRGSTMPTDIRRSDGTVLRFTCTALANHGRMLTYVDVTERARIEERLRHLVFHDHLTGVLNRRGLMEAGDREVARALRQGSPFCVAVLDADHFKRVNDTFGHVVGDKVLTEIAATCRAAARTSDAVGRIGGEEFALVLPDTPVEGALILAERLRARIAAPRPDLPAITASLGIASGKNGERFESILSRADRALYRAKREGRDCVRTEAA